MDCPRNETAVLKGLINRWGSFGEEREKREKAWVMPFSIDQMDSFRYDTFGLSVIHTEDSR